jgi:hypothetical protein
MGATSNMFGTFANSGFLGIGIGDIIRIGTGIIGDLTGPGGNGGGREREFFGRTACPEGTACSGPSVAGICLGACRTIADPGRIDPCPAGFRFGTLADGSLGCVPENGDAFAPRSMPQAVPGACGCGASSSSSCGCPDPLACCTKTGKKGRLTKTGKCRKKPSMDFSNGRAARRATRRLKGHKRQLDATQAALEAIVGPRPRRRRRK